MYNDYLADKTWKKIYAFLERQEGIDVQDEEACRRFVEAVFWRLCQGTQWRSLPKEYGAWNSIYKRFVRWRKKGVWTGLHKHIADDPDMENVVTCLTRQHALTVQNSKN